MRNYKRYRKRKTSRIKRLFANLFYMFMLIGIVFFSGKYIIKTTYAVLTSAQEMGSLEYDTLILVNKENTLSEEYSPKNLIEVDINFPSGAASEQKMMREDAAIALIELFKEAEKDETILYGVSGYRSYSYQKQIYDRKVKSVGKKEANKYVAYPGQSEHQTGLAIDVTNEAGISKLLMESFGKTKEGKWLEENAHNFGFIIRYPKGKEEITGYNYEPWHLRYVGKKASKEIKSQGVVLEEYLKSN